jgi:hypothetical protein
MPKTTVDAINKILVVPVYITAETGASAKKNTATIYNAISKRISIT